MFWLLNFEALTSGVGGSLTVSLLILAALKLILCVIQLQGTGLFWKAFHTVLQYNNSGLENQLRVAEQAVSLSSACLRERSSSGGSTKSWGSAQCPQPPMYTRPLWRRDEAFILPANCTSPCFLPHIEHVKKEWMKNPKEKLVLLSFLKVTKRNGASFFGAHKSRYFLYYLIGIWRKMHERAF